MTASTIVLDRVTTLTGETLETADLSLLGRGILTINPDGDGNTSYPETAKFTGVTAATKTLTGVTRGLDKAATENTSYMRYHPVGTPVIVSFGVHNIADIISYIALQTFTSRQILVAGTAGETLAAGNLCYFKVADGRWWKTDADDAATIENVQLGIAQGAGAAAGLVTGGMLLFGLDQNQSGMTVGAIQYASNTAGGISGSAGTTSVIVGHAKTATELYFNPALGLITINGTQTLTNKTFTGSKFRMTINEQTDSYTLVLTDESKLVDMNKGTANTLTVPPNSSVAFAVGTRILIRQKGAGQTTLTAGGGVTINSSDAALKIYKQYGVAVLIKIATDTWNAEGNLVV